MTFQYDDYRAFVVLLLAMKGYTFTAIYIIILLTKVYICPIHWSCVQNENENMVFYASFVHIV